MGKLKSVRTFGSVGIYVETEVKQPVRRGGTGGDYAGKLYGVLEVQQRSLDPPFGLRERRGADPLQSMGLQ